MKNNEFSEDGNHVSPALIDKALDDMVIQVREYEKEVKQLKVIMNNPVYQRDTPEMEKEKHRQRLERLERLVETFKISGNTYSINHMPSLEELSEPFYNGRIKEIRIQ